MPKYSFSAAERYAVFTVNGEKCYICNAPLNLKTMEVDHVIPESLLDKPQRLAGVLKALGRPDDFDLNWFANWLPACRSCNSKKLDTVFEPSLLVQIAFQRAAENAHKAEELVKEYDQREENRQRAECPGAGQRSGSVPGVGHRCAKAACRISHGASHA